MRSRRESLRGSSALRKDFWPVSRYCSALRANAQSVSPAITQQLLSANYNCSNGPIHVETCTHMITGHRPQSTAELVAVTLHNVAGRCTAKLKAALIDSDILRNRSPAHNLRCPWPLAPHQRSLRDRERAGVCLSPAFQERQVMLLILRSCSSLRIWLWQRGGGR